MAVGRCLFRFDDSVASFACAGHCLADEEVDVGLERLGHVGVNGTRLVVGWDKVGSVAF